MKNHIANSVKIGDVVYNCFMEPLVVLDKSINNLRFIVSDDKNKTHEYSSKDLYVNNLYGEDEDEKSWVLWAKDNKDFLYTFDHIETMKEVYKTGFTNGYDKK